MGKDVISAPMSKNRRRKEPQPSSDWVEQGTAMDALRAMLMRAEVTTVQFHAVFGRIQSEVRDPAVHVLMERMLYADDPEEVTLMRSGRIPTVSGLERIDLADMSCRTFQEEVRSVMQLPLNTRLKECR